MKRKQMIAGVLLLFFLLLTWAAFTALIQGAEVEQIRRENESLRIELNQAVGRLTRLATWMATMGLPTEVKPLEVEAPEAESPPDVEDEGSSPIPEEVSRASDFSASGITYPAVDQATIDRFFPAGLGPHIEIYLSWREKYPEGYVNLIRWGRAFLTGDTANYPPLQIDPAMYEACILAAVGQNIDCYFAHYPASPLNGYGRQFASAGYKYGVSPYLIAALTAAESTFATDGSLCRTHRNAWGMKGPNKTGLYAEDGWMWWPDWGAAVDGAAYFVSVYWPGAQTAYSLRGYCEGNPPEWIRNVEVVRTGMEAKGR